MRTFPLLMGLAAAAGHDLYRAVTTDSLAKVRFYKRIKE